MDLQLTMIFKKKTCSFIVGFFFISLFVSGQDQKIADSLILIYESGEYQNEELSLLYEIAIHEKIPKKKLEFSELLIKKATGDSLLYNGFLQKGNALQEMGNNVQAMESYFKSLNYAHSANHQVGIGSLMISIADTYSIMGNSNNAQEYYNNGIQLLRKLGDSVKIATALLNAGDEAFNNNKYNKAIQYFEESGLIFKNIDYLIGTAYNLGNLGMVYAEQGKDVLAEANINEAISILEELEDYYPISIYLTYMSDIYIKRLDFNTALGYLQQSLNLAKQYGLKDQMSDANLKLSELYESFGNYEESHSYYKQHIAYRDSVKNIKGVQQMADLRTDYEVSQKQVEVDLLSQQKRNQLIILGFTGVLLLTLFWYYRTISREKKRSDNLLLNILPSEIAKELKQNGKVEALKFDKVTVLFTDFVQFSKIAEHTDPEQLVKSIDFYFKKFDDITTKYGLEKIKTIGDSYMCACGLPTPNPEHASNAIKAAKEMTDIVKEELNTQDGLSHFEVRVGLHTGPVVAGIVGIKKWQYDIWGDTVNIASRMETNSKPGRVNLSETTYDEIKNEFPCEYRGEIEVKNRGMLKMYFLS